MGIKKVVIVLSFNYSRMIRKPQSFLSTNGSICETGESAQLTGFNTEFILSNYLTLLSKQFVNFPRYQPYLARS